MSWCRWGSPCDGTIPAGLYKVDEDCAANGCPGSALYIYESNDEANEDCFVCCTCILRTGEGDFTAKDEAAMYAHLLEHEAAGHHVRRSLLEWARTGKEPELSASGKEWREMLAPAAG